MKGTPTVTSYSPNTGTANKCYNNGTGDIAVTDIIYECETGFSGLGFAATTAGSLIVFHWTADAEI